MDAAVALAGFVWGWVLPLSLQGLVLLSAAAVLDRLLPGTLWPELRFAALLVLFLRLLLPPAPGAFLPALAAFLPAGPAWLDPGPFDPLEPGTRRLGFLVAGLWSAGGLALVTLEGVRAARRNALWRRARPLGVEAEAALRSAANRMGLRRLPAARVLPGLASPCVFGIPAPRLLLPAELPAAELEPSLLHELAHVRRGDLLVGALISLVRTLFWFHPLVHLGARRLADLGELCCDRTVIRRIGAGVGAYRHALLECAARRHGQALAGLAFVGGSSLLARLAALERIERDRPGLRRTLALFVMLGTFGCALTVGPPAERRAREMAEIITRPPGCLQLRFLIMERMARERRVDPPPTTHHP